MILIFSEDEDYSTNEVVFYLRQYDKPYYRLNSENEIDSVDIEWNSGSQLSFAGIEFKEIRSIWFRRSEFYIKPYESSVDDYEVSSYLNRYHKNEAWSLNYFVNYVLSSKYKSLGNPLVVSVNKMLSLSRASEVGFKIPEWIVTTKKDIVKKFKENIGAIILKGVQEQIDMYSPSEHYRFANYAEEVDDKLIENLPEKFYPSFFQKKVEKINDIRVFVLNQKIYSMAIFSQNNNRTKVDFRKYDSEKPNRCVPFKLPNDIEQKILRLLDISKLNTASLDLIFSTTGDFYFLEINPVGQFGMVSYPCNYYIEKEIATFL